MKISKKNLWFWRAFLFFCITGACIVFTYYEIKVGNFVMIAFLGGYFSYKFLMPQR